VCFPRPHISQQQYPVKCVARGPHINQQQYPVKCVARGHHINQQQYPVKCVARGPTWRKLTRTTIPSTCVARSPLPDYLSVGQYENRLGKLKGQTIHHHHPRSDHSPGTLQFTILEKCQDNHSLEIVESPWIWKFSKIHHATWTFNTHAGFKRKPVRNLHNNLGFSCSVYIFSSLVLVRDIRPTPNISVGGGSWPNLFIDFPHCFFGGEGSVTGLTPFCPYSQESSKHTGICLRQFLVHV
jgi:hypothetical protein